MGWRDNMGWDENKLKKFKTVHSKLNKKKKEEVDKIHKKDTIATIATIATSAPENQNLKKVQNNPSENKSEDPFQNYLDYLLENGIKIERMSTCLHNEYCKFMSFNGLRQICKKNNKPIFDIKVCPVDYWYIPIDYNHNNTDKEYEKKEENIEKSIFEKCPARCKRSRKCYGVVYFLGKSGKAEECKKEKCQWIDKLKI